MKKAISAILFVFCLFSAASAQFVEKKTLSLDGAEKVIAAAKAEAKRVGAPGGVIAVVDDGGNLVALARLDGTFAAGANISIGKARTAALFKKPTRAFEEIIKNGRTAMVALNDFTPLQGGVPIIADGQIVGAVGVSGAASAQQELAIAAANAFSQAQAALAPVRFYPAAEVETAFQKGAVLFDGAGGNYIIHASRREKSGSDEVHQQDADLIRRVRDSCRRSSNPHTRKCEFCRRGHDSDPGRNWLSPRQGGGARAALRDCAHSGSCWRGRILSGSASETGRRRDCDRTRGIPR